MLISLHRKEGKDYKPNTKKKKNPTDLVNLLLREHNEK